MRGISLSRDSRTTILIPDDALDDAQRAGWAAGESAALVAEHALTDAVGAALTQTLIRAQQGAVGDIGTHALLYAPESGDWGTLHITVVDRELAVEEQRAILHPPAIFAPRVRVVDAAHLGTGCSSSAILGESSAVVRWLFMSPGVTVVANLEVRSPRGVMPLAVIAEDLVLSTQLQGAGAENPEVFDPAALATVVDTDDRAWQL